MLTNLLSFASVMGTIGSIAVAALILLATITVHEFGHYIIGKLFGFKITEFAIGMGPAIFKKTKKNGEIFSVRVFPLGGFCAFEGEAEDEASRKEKAEKEENGESTPTLSASSGLSVKESEKKPLSENAFNNKPPWQRILVLVAGATMNFIAAILVICINFSCFGHFQLAAAEILPNEPSSIQASHSLAAGDVITDINGKYVYLTTDISSALNGKKQNDVVKVGVIRNGEKQTVEVALRCDVEITSLSDYFPAFDALGVATVLSLGAEATSVIPDGAYVFRLADAEQYEDCTRVYDANGLYEALKTLSAGETLDLYISRDGKEREKITLTTASDYAEVDKTDKKAVLKYFGVESAGLTYQLSNENVRMNFFEALYRAPAYAVKTAGVTLQSMGELIVGKMSVSQMSGPIGTIALTSQQVARGLDYVLEMMALIGISVAVFNLLPIPALDGARAIFTLIEWVRGKPINRNVEAMIHFVGLILLLGFAIFVDVIKLFI